MNTNLIALIEIGGSHDECLLTQIHAIKSAGKKVMLITTQEVLNRNPNFPKEIDLSFLVNMSGSKADQKREIGRIWKHLKSTGSEKVVLNTAQGNLVRLLCWKAMFHKMEFVGIIHTTRKFDGSFTQKLINLKIKRYLVLSAFLLSRISPPGRIKLDWFYPIRFASSPQLIEKRTASVCVVGGVEERRKDLSGFLRMAESVQNENIRFVFLGKSDPEKEEVRTFLQEIKERGLSEKVLTFDHFVDQQRFDNYVQNSDLILPLVHPDTPSADQYFKNQISGAMNVSFGYKIPMMAHEAYEQIEEMQCASFYYNLENFSAKLTESLGQLEEKKERMRSHEAYNIEFQEQRYLDFLFSESK